MKYMPIVPVGLLDVLDVAKVRDVFILSQYWGIKEYREFYCSRTWRNVVLDNALYEDPEATNFDDMVQMAMKLDAKRIFVVGPEKLNDGIMTGQMTLDILDEYGSQGFLGDNIQMMCILHERPNEMLRQWNMVRDCKDLALGISIFSYRLGYDRGSLYKFLDIPRSRYTHAFGWDNLLETYNMKDCFDSVDSSICVSAAYNKINLKQNWQITRNEKFDGCVIKPRIPINANAAGLKVLVGKEHMMRFTAKVVKNIEFLTDHCMREDPMYVEKELP